MALPDWVKLPPKDNNEAIFGIGSGNSFESAKKNALADIAAKFNANVKESYVSTQKVLNGKVSSDTTIDTQVEIQGTKLNHFRVTQSKKEESLYWVLVELDRQAFAKNMYEQWFRLDGEISNLMSQIGTTPSLLYINLIDTSLIKVEQLKAVLVQLNFLQGQESFKALFTLYNNHQNLLSKLKDNQFVYLNLQNVHQAIAAMITKQLTSRGVKLVDSSKHENTLYTAIKVTTKHEQYIDDRQAHVSQLEIYFQTDSPDGEKIGANSFSARGRDYNSATGSFNKAITGIQQQLKRLSLNTLLNINSE